MRILHVIGEMGYGGAELLVGEMSSRLVASGHFVQVLVLGFCEPDVESALTARGVVVIRLDARLSSPANAWRIARWIQSTRADIVHAHLFPSLYWVAMAKALVRGSRAWFYTEHSTTNGRRRLRLLRGIEKWIYARYGHVLCISADVRSSLASWLGRRDLALVENGIDIARFRDATAVVRSDIGVGVNDQVLLSVGAFRPEKNQAALVWALSMLPGRFVLVFAGDGPTRPAVEALARSLEVSHRIRFLGVYRNVEGLMKLADFYVLPSLFEGFGLSALEACAAGVPVVHSDVAGLSATLDSAGWPVDPLEPESICRGILAAEASAEEVRRRVAWGVIVAGRYDIESTVAKHLGLYSGEGL